jgi:hypothetical protein
VARSAASVDVSRDRIRQWLTKRRNSPAFARFTNHFAVLDVVLTAMLDRIAAELAGIDGGESSGAVYQRCARLDKSLVTAVRLFEWYAAKYDQRLDSRTADALKAADEIVRSCWAEPFALLGAKPPTGPLAYLEADFDATATPRVSVPPDLRAPADSLIADMTNELPIPVIALPGFAASNAWWLVLAAHETGHHVQHDLLPGLEDATRDGLALAVPADQAALWAGWRLETFADAYATLMAGEAAAWAIGELQHAPPAALCKTGEPGRSRYPPPAVRLALLGECLRAAGQAAGWPAADAVRAWLDGPECAGVPATAREAIGSQLAAAPAAAAALIGLPVGGHRLSELGQTDPGLLRQPRLLRAWAAQLTGDRPVLDSLAAPAAARLVIAAGVAAYRAWAQRPQAPDVLPVIHANLLTVLPACGPPGVLEAPPRQADVTALAARLAGRLVRETPAEAA